LSDMSFPPEKIVMDALTSTVGYGLEYTYSIMERIRLSGLGGDDKLRMPMMITPGRESSVCKESWSSVTDNPDWGREELRSAYWEITTTMSLLLAGADLIIMYHPEAVQVVKQKIAQLFNPVVDEFINRQ
jgi:acetyl-CoA decarbonylase/synthase complex subunit delta